MEGGRVLTDRRHRRSCPRRPRRCAGHPQTQRQRAPILCCPRHRDNRRIAERRCHRAWHNPNQNGRHGGRGLGVVVLPPARPQIPPGLHAVVRPVGRPRHFGNPRCAAHGRCLRHQAWRRRLYAGHQRARPRRSHGAATPVRAAVSADVRQALARTVARRAGGPEIRTRNTPHMGPRSANADGADAYPRPRARPGDHPPDLCACAAIVAGAQGSCDHGQLGRLYRHNARRRSGHR